MLDKRWAALALVAGIIFGATTLRAASPPSVAWSKQFGTAGDDDGSGVIFDKLGHLYITGYTTGLLGPSSFGAVDAYLAKYDLQGNQIWLNQFGTTASELGVDIQTDTFGNVYLVGRTTGNLAGPNAGLLDAFIAKYDPSGAPIWTRQFGTSGNEFATAVSIDPLGNAYVAGRTSGSLAAPNAGDFDVYLAKYDTNGNQTWIKQFGNSTWDDSFGVSADAFGNIFLVGDSEGNIDGPSAGSRDIFLRRYDANGNLIWGQQFGTFTWDKSFSAVADGFGNVYFTGWTRGNLGGPSAGVYDGIVRKYDSSGNLLWARQFGTSLYDYSFGVSADPLGNVYLSGFQGALEVSSTVTGGDAFVAKYSADGDFLWKHLSASATGKEYAFDVAAGEPGTVYAIGGTSGDLFGPLIGDYDIVLYKLSEVPEPTTCCSALLALSALCFTRRRHA